MSSQLITRLGSAYLESQAVTPSTAEMRCLRHWLNSEAKSLPFHFYPVLEDVSLESSLEFIKSGLPLPVSLIGINHPHLTPRENLTFRAIHDYHHYLTGANDSFIGEILTYHWSTLTAPQSIHWILFSEIVLQAAAQILTGEFQVQKLVRLNPSLALVQ